MSVSPSQVLSAKMPFLRTWLKMKCSPTHSVRRATPHFEKPQGRVRTCFKKTFLHRQTKLQPRNPAELASYSRREVKLSLTTQWMRQEQTVGR